MDAEILLWFQSIRTPFLNTVFLQISNLVWVLIVVGIVLCMMSKTRKTGIYLLLSLIICGAVNSFGLKMMFMRVRPFIAVEGLKHVGSIPMGSSFPSSHTTLAFSFAWMMLWMKNKQGAVLSFLVAILVAISRMYLGVHYPSDVLAGVLVSALLSYLVYKGLQKASI